MGYKLSASSLNLMLECPRCFWLHFHDHYKRPSGIFPSLPGGMDRILKLHFDRFIEKKLMPPELRKNGTCEGMKLFDNRELLNAWRSVHKGLIWEDNKGNILRGAVDNLLVKGKKFVVLDYKTRGSPIKEDTAEKNQHQLDIYNFLLRVNGHPTEDFAFLLFYYPKDVLETGEVLFDTQLVKMKVEAERGKKLFQNALKLLEGPCPIKHKDKECEWCRLVALESE